MSAAGLTFAFQEVCYQQMYRRHVHQRKDVSQAHVPVQVHTPW